MGVSRASRSWVSFAWVPHHGMEGGIYQSKHRQVQTACLQTLKPAEIQWAESVKWFFSSQGSCLKRPEGPWQKSTYFYTLTVQGPEGDWLRGRCLRWTHLNSCEMNPVPGDSLTVWNLKMDSQQNVGQSPITFSSTLHYFYCSWWFNWNFHKLLVV